MKPGTYAEANKWTGGVAQKRTTAQKLTDMAFNTGLQVGLGMMERAQLEKEKQEFKAQATSMMQQLMLAQAQMQQGAMGPGGPPPGMPPAGPEQGAPLPPPDMGQMQGM